MAVAQSDFNIYRTKGFDGQVSTIDVADIVSGSMDSDVGFARAVVHGSSERSFDVVTGSTTAADIRGITVRTLASESASVPSVPADYSFGYGEGDHASVLRSGRMYLLCEDGATSGNSAFVVINDAGGFELGQILGAEDGTEGANTVELTQVKWLYDVAAGEYGEVQLDGILTT